MDGSRFDAWTRRRFGAAMGGGLAALLGLATLDETEAKNHHKKKPRCIKEASARCSRKKPCCKKKGLTCLPTLENPGGPLRCCRVGKERCQSDEECCSGSCMDNRCSCKSNGQECGGIGLLCCSLNCEGGDSNTATCQPK